MESEHPFTWFSLLPFVSDKNIHVVTALFVALLLFYLCRKVLSSLKTAPNPLIPPEKITVRNLFEVVIQMTLAIMKDIIGPSAEKFLPLIGSLFIFILFCNLLGLIPGFLPPTSNINTTAAIALIVFFYYNYQGFKTHGLRYLKQMMGPLIWIAPLMFVIELVSHLFRPFSLSVRLFGNMFGDHTILGIFTGLIPLLIPVIFYVLGFLVALIQAFIFSALSAVYISLAISHEH